MKKELDEVTSHVQQYRTEAQANEEKVSALESQFIELNKAMEQNQINPIGSTASDAEHTGTSIIKIDAAYVSSLQSKAVELQNQIKKLKERNETMTEKMKMEGELRGQIDDLSLKLEARELEVKALESSYSSHRAGRPEFGRCLSSVLSGSMSGNESEYSEDDELTVEELKVIVSKRDKMIKQLKSKLANLEQTLKTVGPRAAVINLRKVSLLQEMQDNVIRRLNVLINRMDDNRETEEELEEEFMSPSKSFLISMSDKLSILHDYQKISLHLLESRLTNEIESLRSGGKPVEMNEDVEARFERTLQTLKKSEKDVESQLKNFGSELQHHNIKLSAKNGVIEKLLTKDREHNSSIETLRTELDIFKGLQQFTNVNMGMMARFKECAKLERELEEKDMVIQRLNNVIEEYRYENQ